MQDACDICLWRKNFKDRKFNTVKSFTCVNLIAWKCLKCVKLKCSVCVELTITKNNIFLLAFSNETNPIYLFHIGRQGDKYSALQPRSCPSLTEERFILFLVLRYMYCVFWLFSTSVTFITRLPFSSKLLAIFDCMRCLVCRLLLKLLY